MVVTQIEIMKYAILALGLWLAGAQGFAAQACCSEMPSPKAACDGCGDESDGKTSSRPDCCTSLEAQKDVDVVITRNDVPQHPIVADLLTEDMSFRPWRPQGDLVVRAAGSHAEDPPLYLRYEILLI